MLTMVIGGLWHGAAWNFVLWGFYHGRLLVGHRIARPLAETLFDAKSSAGKAFSKAARIAIMFVFTCYGWLLFRAESLHQIVHMTRLLAHPLAGYDRTLFLTVVGFASPLILVQLFQYLRGRLNFLDFAWLPVEARFALYSIAAYFVFFLGGQPMSFIYFQF